MDQKTLDLIVDAARETASDKLRTAVSSAKDQDQLSNHMAFLEVEATHIMATVGFNRIRQRGSNLKNELEYLAGQILTELGWLLSESDQMEKLMPGDPVTKPGVKN